MGTCFCTGACREGRPCAAYPYGNPPQPLEQGNTWIVSPPPLTEEDIRRIVREEIDRGKA